MVKSRFFFFFLCCYVCSDGVQMGRVASRSEISRPRWSHSAFCDSSLLISRLLPPSSFRSHGFAKSRNERHGRICGGNAILLNGMCDTSLTCETDTKLHQQIGIVIAFAGFGDSEINRRMAGEAELPLLSHEK